jgi:hypothetical protein
VELIRCDEAHVNVLKPIIRNQLEEVELIPQNSIMKEVHATDILLIINLHAHIVPEEHLKQLAIAIMIPHLVADTHLLDVADTTR